MAASVYIAGPLVGAVIAWVLYKVVVTGDTDLMDDMGDIRDSFRYADALRDAVRGPEGPLMSRVRL